MENKSNHELYYKDQVGTEVLKGGYTLYYTEDDALKKVFLKDKFQNRQLNSLPIDEGSYYYLGIVLADFDSSFILGHDNGNGVPYSYELINKSSGLNILKHKVTVIEGNYDINKYLVYYTEEDSSLIDKFVLYSIDSNSKKSFNLPTEVTAQLPKFNFISASVDTVLTKKIKVVFELKPKTITKIYNR